MKTTYRSRLKKYENWSFFHHRVPLPDSSVLDSYILWKTSQQEGGPGVRRHRSPVARSSRWVQHVLVLTGRVLLCKDQRLHSQALQENEAIPRHWFHSEPPLPDWRQTSDIYLEEKNNHFLPVSFKKLKGRPCCFYSMPWNLVESDHWLVLLKFHEKSYWQYLFLSFHSLIHICLFHCIKGFQKQCTLIFFLQKALSGQK